MEYVKNVIKKNSNFELLISFYSPLYITHMALQITTFSNKDQKIKAVIFGDSGTGKTSFAGTAARKYKTLFISAEG